MITGKPAEPARRALYLFVVGRCLWIAAQARDSFSRFAELLPSKTPDIRLLGTSGTVTTLASVHLALPSYDRRAVDGSRSDHSA